MDRQLDKQRHVVDKWTDNCTDIQATCRVKCTEICIPAIIKQIWGMQHLECNSVKI